MFQKGVQSWKWGDGAVVGTMPEDRVTRPEGCMFWFCGVVWRGLVWCGVA